MEEKYQVTITFEADTIDEARELAERVRKIIQEMGSDATVDDSTVGATRD
jgi:hypothetical protein